MSSTFQIHQDADKENPIKMQLKESLIENKQQAHNAGGGGGGGKQPLSVIGGVGNANVLRLHSPAAHKVLRDTKNVSKKHNSNKDAAEAKKSNVVPVVEQFKTFSVYEDCNDNQQKTNQQESLERNEKISSQIFIDKENATEKFTKLQQRNKKPTQNDGKSSDILHKDFSLNEDEYIFDTTPMSVSDVLSPMSVDRSQLSISAMLSDSTSNKSAENNKDKEANEECKSESSQLKVKEQIPRNDRQRFFEVVEYQRSILEYFRESEKKHRPKPHYMRRQSDITHAMRTILVDWLVEVCEEYNLDTETLYLSVSYIDRFLSQMSVVRNKLQLVGTAAMYIASKYEEIYPPDVGEFVFITDDTYVKPQVLRMEQIILKILAFDLCTPTGYVFINTYAVLCDIPDKVKFLAQYICELSLLDADPYLRFYPSIISAASVALAFYVLGHPIWSSELEEITTYRLEDLKEVFLHLVKSHNKATTMDQQAIQDKYKAEKYLKVSTITPIEINETRLDQIVLDYNAEMEKQKNSKNGITPKEKLQLFKF